jgi:kumamolisin
MKPYLKHPRIANPPGTWDITALCAAYQWPSNLAGGGKIAIIELGGGWVRFDLKKFFNFNGMPIPIITDISVDGTTNSHQSPTNDSDIEVALDIEVAGAAYQIATGKKAEINVYWTQDIAAGITRAAEDGCVVCSISWGADEAEWGHAALEALEQAAATATAKGMVIFAAAGDNDSSDGGSTPANVDAPGSCPHVISCGGTTKPQTIWETVWNNNPGQTDGSGTGGGYSATFPIESWQVGAPPAPTRLPNDKNPGRGRMVPDVAANADPNTGYNIVTYAQWLTVGGTSAVAPLYAGLFAAFGTGLGFISPALWELVNRNCFSDIVSGNNGDYSAGPGPDPCTGLGVPIGEAMAKAFTRVNPAVKAGIANTNPPTHYWGS